MDYGKTTDFSTTAVGVEGDTFDFCGGHSSSSTAVSYHIHVPPSCLLRQLGASASSHSPQIGWAFDGFPIYGPRGEGGVLVKRCSLGNSAPCVDDCGGIEGTYLDDGYKYRYYIMGPVNDGTSCDMPNSESGTMDESIWAQYYPMTPICFRGCKIATVSGTTLSGIPSCTSTSSQGTTTVKAAVAALAINTQPSGCAAGTDPNTVGLGPSRGGFRMNGGSSDEGEKKDSPKKGKSGTSNPFGSFRVQEGTVNIALPTKPAPAATKPVAAAAAKPAAGAVQLPYGVPPAGSRLPAGYVPPPKPTDVAQALPVTARTPIAGTFPYGNALGYGTTLGYGAGIGYGATNIYSGYASVAAPAYARATVTPAYGGVGYGAGIGYGTTNGYGAGIGYGATNLGYGGYSSVAAPAYGGYGGFGGTTTTLPLPNILVPLALPPIKQTQLPPTSEISS